MVTCSLTLTLASPRSVIRILRIRARWLWYLSELYRDYAVGITLAELTTALEYETWLEQIRTPNNPQA